MLQVALPRRWILAAPQTIHTGKDLTEWNATCQQMRMDYAKKVRALRMRLKLTQEEAGRILGGASAPFKSMRLGRLPRLMPP